MKKRLLPLLSAAVLLLTPAAYTQAAAYNRVFDEAGLLSAAEAETVDAAIIDFQETTGYDFAVVITNADLGTPDYQQILDELYLGQSLGLGMNHTALLCYYDIFNNYFYIFPYGDLNSLMATEDLQFLLDNTLTYFSQAKFTDGFLWMINMLGEALGNIGNEHQTNRVFDYAELFTEEGAAALESAIADFRTLSGMDFVVLTTNADLGDETDDQYMVNFYIRRGIGIGDGRNGVMLYLDMFNGNYYIRNYGSGEMDAVVPQAGVDAIQAQCDPLMREGKIQEAALQVIQAYAAYFQ